MPAVSVSNYEEGRLDRLTNLLDEFSGQFKDNQVPCQEEVEEETEEESPKYSPIVKRRRRLVFKKFHATRRSTRERKENGLTDGLSDDENEEEYVEEKKRPKKTRTPRIVLKQPNPRDNIKPEDITQDDIDNICYKSAQKNYDAIHGTTCHQCRQKTTDTKSICRNSECSGVRGQFCGFCLKNRYGEDVAIVLKDPDWSCPPCRDICNCSICRTRNGKRPTGILAPYVKNDGFASVKDFLEKHQDEL